MRKRRDRYRDPNLADQYRAAIRAALTAATEGDE